MVTPQSLGKDFSCFYPFLFCFALTTSWLYPGKFLESAVDLRQEKIRGAGATQTR